MTNATLPETEPLLGSTPPSSSVKVLVKYFSDTVDVRRGDILLLSCYFITGILDASAIFAWGAFISMQTGNTVYLGLGVAEYFGLGVSAAGQGGRLGKSAISILGFGLGSKAFATLHRFFPARKRWLMCVSFAIQMACIICAAFCATLKDPITDTAPSLFLENGLWALIAFQSGGQAVMSRVLSFNSLTSVVLTSIYCDFFASSALLSPQAPGRKEQMQRAGAIVLLIAGAFFGGFLARTSAGVVGALWVAAFLKGCIVIMWIFWAAERS